MLIPDHLHQYRHLLFLRQTSRSLYDISKIWSCVFPWSPKLQNTVKIEFTYKYFLTKKHADISKVQVQLVDLSHEVVTIRNRRIKRYVRLKGIFSINWSFIEPRIKGFVGLRFPGVRIAENVHHSEIITKFHVTSKEFCQCHQHVLVIVYRTTKIHLSVTLSVNSIRSTNLNWCFVEFPKDAPISCHFSWISS